MFSCWWYVLVQEANLESDNVGSDCGMRLKRKDAERE